MTIARRRTTTGLVHSGRSVILGVAFLGDTSSGTLEVRDGAGGQLKLELDVEGNGAERSVNVPGPGIFCGTGIHVTLTNIVGVTVFFREA